MVTAGQIILLPSVFWEGGAWGGNLFLKKVSSPPSFMTIAASYTERRRASGPDQDVQTASRGRKRRASYVLTFLFLLWILRAARRVERITLDEERGHDEEEGRDGPEDEAHGEDRRRSLGLVRPESREAQDERRQPPEKAAPNLAMKVHMP